MTLRDTQTPAAGRRTGGLLDSAGRSSRPHRHRAGRPRATACWSRRTRAGRRRRRRPGALDQDHRRLRARAPANDTANWASSTGSEHTRHSQTRKQNFFSLRFYIHGTFFVHGHRSVCLFVCLSVCLFDCADFFSAVFDPISIKLGHILYILV